MSTLLHLNINFCTKKLTLPNSLSFCSWSKKLLPRNLHRRLSGKAQDEGMAKSVGESHNFPKEEERIIELWNKLDAFKTSLKQSEGKPKYVVQT